MHEKIFCFFAFFISIQSCFSQTDYTFNGNGYWSNTSNWSTGIVPPSTAPAGTTIYISPVPGGICILDVPQTFPVGAGLVIAPGANFIIAGNMVLTNLPPIDICNQNWTTRNLDVVTYRNGDTIPNVTNPGLWSSLTTGAWCYYNNDSLLGSEYGKLYNWYAVNDPRGLSPQGWHIPTDAEWLTLENCLGGASVAGSALKDTGILHWSSPNSDATNISGFNAYGGGNRDSSGQNFYSLGFNGFWWSRDSVNDAKANYAYLYSYLSYFSRAVQSMEEGYSVRCIRNSVPNVTTVTPTVSPSNVISGGIISSDGGFSVISKGVVWSQNEHPTVDLLTKTNDGNGINFYTSELSNLEPGVTYYLRAYASNRLGTGYGNEVVFVNTSSDSSIDICLQRWMKKNLEVVTYRNGDTIPEVQNFSDWINLTTGAWCYYNNDPATASTYGKLYNWYAVNDSRGLAPTGWHIPSINEVVELSNCAGGDRVSGGALKEIGEAHWANPNTGATDSTGFTALPGGYRFDDGNFYFLNYGGLFWTNSSFSQDNAFYIYLQNNEENMNRPVAAKKNALSIRCVRD